MKVLMFVAVLGATFSTALLANEEVNSGGIESLRGISTLDETRKADSMKRVIKDKNPIARNYVHQPPLIPHQIRGYRVDLNSNKCLTCHGWKHAAATGATKVGTTHFETRDGKTLSDVSPRRYFCTQCHVTQADARPLVENDFEPVESLSND